MFIQTESTPNPATMKFLPGTEVMPVGTVNFLTVEEAVNSPLAQSLFGIDGVVGVFLGLDFITVTKANDWAWDTIKPLILGGIMGHFQSGRPVVETCDSDGSGGEAEDEDDEVVVQIRELIDTRVRPAVAQDGGDIVYKGFEDGIVYLHMQGACAGCPSSTETLKYGIENMLRHYVPEVQEVRAVE